MEKTIVYCDRCGKETASYTDHTKLWCSKRVSCLKWKFSESIYERQDAAVLCKDCFNAFNAWMKEGGNT